MANGEFVIEKGIPIPDINHGPKKASKYPFNRMEVGDSVLIEGMRSRDAGSRLVYVRKKTEKKFTVRAVDGGCRVWRTE